jgi:hypothetical protein
MLLRIVSTAGLPNVLESRKAITDPIVSPIVLRTMPRRGP